VPYPTLQESIRSGGMLHQLAKSTSKRLMFYCAFGECSAMAVQAAQDAGLTTACHIVGGLDAWKKAKRATDALDQLADIAQTLRRHDPELRQMRPQRVHQHCALAHQLLRGHDAAAQPPAARLS
jgi:hypothetical protein